jgi:hypothetical protein
MAETKNNSEDQPQPSRSREGKATPRGEPSSPVRRTSSETSDNPVVRSDSNSRLSKNYPELLFTSVNGKPQIRAGTMAKIVEWLIDNGPEHVPTVITFLVAFRQFCEPRELFKLIVDKYLRHHYSAGFYLKLLEFFLFLPMAI